MSTVDGWPQVYIPNGETETWSAIRWDNFPKKLTGEIAVYRMKMTTVDPFDDQHRRISSVTVDGYIQRLKVIASHVVYDGLPIERFDGLEAFLDEDLVKRGLTLIIGDRVLSDVTATTHATMTAILSVANYLNAPDLKMKELRKIAKKVKHRPVGMAQKNKQRLEPLKDKTLRKRFFQLPLVTMARLAKIKNPSIKAALEFQIALALEILFDAPMRIKNLSELDLERHINRPPAGTKGEWRISIPKSDVKNGVALDYLLTPETASMLELYLKVFRPVLSSGSSTAVFISQKGTRKGPSALSKRLYRFIWEELGIRFNAHLVRHFVGFCYLEQHPGQYETVRQLLGHKRVETTIAFYSGLEIDEALNRYGAMLQEQRGTAEHVDVL